MARILRTARRLRGSAPPGRIGQGYADNAYSSGGFRTYLRDCGIKCVIIEEADQKANLKRNGRAVGRWSDCDRGGFKPRWAAGRSLNIPWQRRGLATRCALLACPTARRSSCKSCTSGAPSNEDCELGETPDTATETKVSRCVESGHGQC